VGNNAYINHGGDVINDKVGDVFTVPVTTSSTSMMTTIDVMLGYQDGTSADNGSAFTVSLLGEYM